MHADKTPNAELLVIHQIVPVKLDLKEILSNVVYQSKVIYAWPSEFKLVEIVCFKYPQITCNFKIYRGTTYCLQETMHT